ncbi:MAG: hypothetical protein EBR88_07420 [Betaproteobacteria bacterium]|nr:hypothetical protein [Betaproteobacteria bacterium]
MSQRENEVELGDDRAGNVACRSVFPWVVTNQEPGGVGELQGRDRRKVRLAVELLSSANEVCRDGEILVEGCGAGADGRNL